MKISYKYIVRAVISVTILSVASHGLAIGQNKYQKAVDPLDVAAILPLTGALSSYGEEAKNGIELARTYLQTAMPKQADAIRVSFLDNQGSPKITKDLADDIVNKKRVSVFFGPIGDSSSKTLATIANKEKKPLILPFSSSNSPSLQNDYTFKTSLDDESQGQLLAQYALNILKLKKVAVVEQEFSSHGESIVKGFEQVFLDQGGTVVAKETLAIGSENFLSTLKSLKTKSPEGIILPLNTDLSESIIKALDKMRWSIPVLGSDRWDSREFLAKSKQTSATPYYVTHFDPTIKTHLNEYFVNAYTQKHAKAPTAIAAMSFEAFLTIAEGYKRARSSRSTALKHSLQKLADLDGLLGTYKMKENLTLSKPGVIMQKFKNNSEMSSLLAPIVKLSSHKDRPSTL